MVDITPSDLFDKREVPTSQTAPADIDYLGAIERILDRADSLLSKVAMSRGISLNGSTQATEGAKQGITIANIKTALETVQGVKGDIPISELLELLAENSGLVEGVLNK